MDVINEGRLLKLVDFFFITVTRPDETLWRIVTHCAMTLIPNSITRSVGLTRSLKFRVLLF